MVEQIPEKQAFQCFDCQRIGHPSGECQMGYRCVKCNEIHGPQECKRSLNEKNADQAFCVNCGKHGHPANYRDCPYLKYAQEIVSERKKEEKQRALIKTNGARAHRRSGISYATASRQQEAQSSLTPTFVPNRINPTHGATASQEQHWITKDHNYTKQSPNTSMPSNSK